MCNLFITCICRYSSTSKGDSSYIDFLQIFAESDQMHRRAGTLLFLFLFLFFTVFLNSFFFSSERSTSLTVELRFLILSIEVAALG